MRRGIEAAEAAGIPVEYRNLASFGRKRARSKVAARPLGDVVIHVAD